MIFYDRNADLEGAGETGKSGGSERAEHPSGALLVRGGAAGIQDAGSRFAAAGGSGGFAAAAGAYLWHAEGWGVWNIFCNFVSWNETNNFF